MRFWNFLLYWSLIQNNVCTQLGWLWAFFSVYEFSNPSVCNAEGNIAAVYYEKKKRYVCKLYGTADNFKVVSCN